MDKRTFAILFALLLATAGIIAYIYSRPVLSTPIIKLACADLTQGCGNQLITLKVDKPPQIMRPFQLTVEMPQAKEMHVSFAMRNMDIGFNRYRLIKQADGWHAEVTLPVCSQSRSDWMMLAEAETAEGLVRYQLPFQATHDN
ncbi:MAG: hypothetical protein ACAH12_04955 [Methylophilaceae bacterium]